ncbi:hypothetical protein EIP91_010843, partial [Steccherinum ochraceum]
SKTPEPADWERLLAYADRVRSITYNEAYNNVAPTIFAVIEELRPKQFILPKLTALTWKAETAAGLERSRLFLNPGLQSLTIEMGNKYAKMGDFLNYIMEKTALTTFSFTLHSNLPDNFIDIMQPYSHFQKLALMAPGALAARVGKWTSSLPFLHSFSLDLSNRTTTAVEGFFDDISLGSGYSTPSSVGGTDSGIFSGDELDFSDIRKSAVRLTSDGPRHGAFANLQQIQLTGDTANVATFLKHITSPLSQIDLIIEDPPARDDWQDLCNLICDQFSDTLLSLRVTATSGSRFAELVRSTSRGGDVQLRHLPLEHFAFLSRLQRLEIDLPESAIFHNKDIAHIARVCPNLEVLRLCGQAKFPPSVGSPYLTLEGLVPLTRECKRLHTLSVVLNALEGQPETFLTRDVCSRSLQRLNVGHSWIKDPLGAAVLLSHLAPYLESIKWFSQTTRVGTLDATSAAWQKVSDLLPHLQSIRLMERSLLLREHAVVSRMMCEVMVDATPSTVSRGVTAAPKYVDHAVEVFPEVSEAAVDAVPHTSSIAIGATPELVDAGVTAEPVMVDAGIEAMPETAEMAIETVFVEEEHEPEPTYFISPVISSYIPSVNTVINLPVRAVKVYTYYLTYPLRFMLSFTPSMPIPILTEKQPKSPEIEEVFLEKDMQPMETMPSMPPMPSLYQNALTEAESPVSPDTLHNESDAHLTNATSSESAQSLNDTNTPWSEPTHPKTEAHQHVHASQKGRYTNATIGATNATRQSLEFVSAQLPSRPWYTRPINYNLYNMAEVKKQEKDYTKEVDALLPEAKSLAESGKLQDALDKLYALEKQTRNASDLKSTTRLVKEISQLAYDARNHELLNGSIQTLSKKHGQLKVAIQELVEQAVGWLDEIKKRDGQEKWLQLIETLRTVTEGKLFLETPRARVTLLLSKYHESLIKSPEQTSPTAKECLQTASDLLSDLQVETYSSMERREKTEFILEQMRLLIALARVKDSEKKPSDDKKDIMGGGEGEWVKVRVGGRKVNESFLAEKANEDLKLKYYNMMIEYALNQSEYLDAAKYYYKVWETPSIKEDENGRGRAALERIVYYVVLAPHDNEQSDMLHRLFNDSALLRLDLQYALVKCFTTQELMRWPGIESIYGPNLRQTDVFTSEKLWEDLHTRVIEHNIRIVAKYYTRITLPRLTTLLDLSPKQAEEILCRLVVSGTIWARIDRPTGIVNFRSSKSAEEVMNDWSSDMQRLLSLVEKTWMGVNAAQAAQARVKA